MNELNLIQHPEFGAIRTEVINNDVWFCGKDVCRALGYARHHEALNQHCKLRGTIKHSTPSERGRQEMKFINEGNLYRLILKSKLPAAEKFETWVCEEVLPSIRKTGFYEVGQKKQKELKFGNEDIEVMRMLKVVDSFLLNGDRKRVAEKIGVSQVAINNVLRGHNRSPRILGALYERALENSRKSELETLQLLGNGSILGLSLNATLCYGNPSNGDVMITNRLFGIQFTEEVKSIQQGAKFMEVSLPFIYLDEK